MKTTHTQHDLQHHKLVLRLLKAACPHLFRNKFPHPRKPNPVSTASWFRKEELSKLVPHDINLQACILPPALAEGYRAMLFALAPDDSTNSTQMTSDDEIVVLDSGASCAISHDKSDFDWIKPIQNITLKGIASGLSIKGIGVATWTFTNEFQECVKVPLMALYVPDSPCRLLPPQQLHKQRCPTNGAWIGKGLHAKVFYEGNCIAFQYDSNSNLPIARLAPGIDKFAMFCGITTANASEGSEPTSIRSLPPDNLSVTQRKLLRLHHRYGHQSMDTIQEWARTGFNNVPSDIAKCVKPICHGCQFGAAQRHPHERSNTGSLSKKADQPGDVISVDQMVAGTPGLIPFLSGSAKTSKRRYTCATLWVDHFTKFLWTNLQESTGTAATLESKTAFEAFAKWYDRHIKHIHSNNQIFNSKPFVKHCENQSQSQSFCGVGAHWQNGMIETYIGTTTAHARTMLLHAMAHWPEIIITEFWSLV